MFYSLTFPVSFVNRLNIWYFYGLPASRRTGIYRLLLLLLKKCSMEGGNTVRVYYKMKMHVIVEESIVFSLGNISFANFTSTIMHLRAHQDN